jgi:hypothetical protein
MSVFKDINKVTLCDALFLKRYSIRFGVSFDNMVFDEYSYGNLAYTNKEAIELANNQSISWLEAKFNSIYFMSNSNNIEINL